MVSFLTFQFKFQAFFTEAQGSPSHHYLAFFSLKCKANDMFLPRLFAQFFITSYLKRAERRRSSAASETASIVRQSGRDAFKGVARRMSDAFGEMSVNEELGDDTVLIDGEELKEEMRRAAAETKRNISDAMDKAKQKAGSIDVKNAVSEDLEKLKKNIQGTVQKAKDNLTPKKETTEQIKSKAKQVKDTTYDGMTKVQENASNYIKKASEELSKQAPSEETKENVKGKASEVADKAQETGSQVSKKSKKAARKAGEEAKDKADEAASEANDNAQEGTSSIADDVKEKANKAEEKVDETTPQSTPEKREDTRPEKQRTGADAHKEDGTKNEEAESQDVKRSPKKLSKQGPKEEVKVKHGEDKVIDLKKQPIKHEGTPSSMAHTEDKSFAAAAKS